MASPYEEKISGEMEFQVIIARLKTYLVRFCHCEASQSDVQSNLSYASSVTF